jgi:signal transduction histidine kinase
VSDIDATTREASRLDALQRYRVLDTPPELAFDAIVRLAARICHTPISLISLIDETRQWFKARLGLDLSATIRESSFCAYAIGHEELIVPDALQDERFRDNPLVIGEPYIRFYAGIPLISADGYALGALCVIDREPREGLTPHERQSLELLAREATLQLELRRTALELADTKQEVESINVELQAFDAAVAHDLRAPLRIAKGFSDLVAEECGGRGPIGRHVHRIQESCDRMYAIIDGLLRLSQASHVELNLQEVDLTQLIQEVASEIGNAFPSRQVTLVVQPQMRLRADRALLRAVLVNLLTNAWKFTAANPRARIEVGCERNGQADEYFVRDNGTGFDPAFPPIPARPFAKSRAEGGMGLGLTIVERVIKRHGGTIRATGVPGQGATFTFTLPSVPIARIGNSAKH